MHDLNDIQCFVRAAQLKSLTGAAKSLKLPKSSVSRKIKNLERRLGLTLVIITTRAFNLTEAGRIFFERASYALNELNGAEESLDRSRREVEGLLRITAPVEFSTGPFNDLIASFLKAHPKLKIDLFLTEKVVDLIGDGFDVAFRIGDLKDSTLMAKKLKTYDAQILASPDYLKSRGIPKTIADLEKHDCIAFNPTESPLKWVLSGTEGKKEFTPKGQLTVNHLLALKEATLKGLGIALIPTYMVRKELKEKTLRPIFPGMQAINYPIHLIYPGQKFLSPKLRAFVDHATKNLIL